jgi:hypothetical protein
MDDHFVGFNDRWAKALNMGYEDQYQPKSQTRSPDSNRRFAKQKTKPTDQVGNEKADRYEEHASHPVHTRNFERYCQDTVLVSSIDPAEKKYQPERHPTADQYLPMTPSIEQGQGIQPNENIEMKKCYKGGQYGTKK